MNVTWLYYINVNNFNLVGNFSLMGIFPKWSRTFSEISELINHRSMNWTKFINPASHMCFTGVVVASWSLAQEVAGSSPLL